MIASGLLAQLDDRDRTLFVRWAASPSMSRRARLWWKTLTHCGGATCTIACATIPALAGGATAAISRRALLTLVLSHVLVQIVKRTVGRRRPSRHLGYEALIHEPDRFAFPSGHAAAAMSIAFVYGMSVPMLAPILLPLAMAVGLSRVFLGVHYPGDVVVGQLLAVLSGVAVLAS